MSRRGSLLPSPPALLWAEFLISDLHFFWERQREPRPKRGGHWNASAYISRARRRDPLELVFEPYPSGGPFILLGAVGRINGGLA